MAIGERIRFFRNLRGMTQKYLGMQVGFPEKTADIRMAQYESGSRTPKADLTNNLAEVFGVSEEKVEGVLADTDFQHEYENAPTDEDGLTEEGDEIINNLLENVAQEILA